MTPKVILSDHLPFINLTAVKLLASAAAQCRASRRRVASLCVAFKASSWRTRAAAPRWPCRPWSRQPWPSRCAVQNRVSGSQLPRMGWVKACQTPGDPKLKFMDFHPLRNCIRYPWPYGLDMVRYLPKCQCCLHTFVDRNTTTGVYTGWKILSDTHRYALSAVSAVSAAGNDLVGAPLWSGGHEETWMPLLGGDQEAPHVQRSDGMDNGTPHVEESSVYISKYSESCSSVHSKCYMMLYDVIWCLISHNNI